MEYLQLEIDLILLHLKENSASGVLQADLPERFMLSVFSLKEPGQVQITLQAGEVVSAFIATPRGVVLQHPQRVVGTLAQVGSLYWQLMLAPDPQEISHSQTNPRLAAQPAATNMPLMLSIPYRTQQLPLAYFTDPTARRVYQLIDGQRSIERIAVLARVPSNYALDLIWYLYKQGALELN